MADILFVDTEAFPENQLDDFLAMLPPDEREAVGRIKMFASRRLTLFGKLLVRYYLRAIKQIEDYRISKNKWGKPFVVPSDDSDSGLEFSISHSGTIAAAAFSSFVCGLDIEKIEGRGSLAAIAERFHQDEYAYILGAPDLNTAFFYVWTRKEALLKAIGTGLATDLAAHNCLQEAVADTAGRHGNNWHIKSLDMRKDYVAAFCQNSPLDNVTVRELCYTDFGAV